MRTNSTSFLETGYGLPFFLSEMFFLLKINVDSVQKLMIFQFQTEFCFILLQKQAQYAIICMCVAITALEEFKEIRKQRHGLPSKL